MGIVYTYDNNHFIDPVTGKPVPSHADGQGGFVPDVPGAVPNPNYGQMVQSGEADPAPIANTPGNPYFGKAPKTEGQFLTLAARVLGFAGVNRLLNDPAFAAANRMLQSFDTIDPDDPAGLFLQLAGCGVDLHTVAWAGGGTVTANSGYLSTTNGADGHPLLATADRDAIMAIWE